jgi:N4-gp56 family major capsid protein
MAETAVASLNQVTQWDDMYWFESVRESRYSRYMGPKRNEIFFVDNSLASEPGLVHTFSFIGKLSNAGATGEQSLDGIEENLDNYGMTVTAEWLRNAVRLTKRQAALSEIDMREAVKEGLQVWSKEKLKVACTNALGSINVGTGNGTLYASASEANKDTWLTNNSDRVLFGSAIGNAASLDHSVAMALVDNVNDKFTAARVSLMKRIAKSATPNIAPVKIRDDEEWFVIFAGSRVFRDLKADLATINTYGWERYTNGGDNPLFTDGDLVYDGCIIREEPSIDAISSVGAGSIDVQPAYLCGAASVGVVWKQKTQTIMDNLKDFKFRPGIAVEECRAVEKLYFNSKQNGVLTGYFAGVADS